MKKLNIVVCFLLFFSSCEQKNEVMPKLTIVQEVAQFLNKIGYNEVTITDENALQVTNYLSVGSKEYLLTKLNAFFAARGFTSDFVASTSPKNGRVDRWECFSGPMYDLGDGWWCRNYACFDGNRMDFSTSCIRSR